MSERGGYDDENDPMRYTGHAMTARLVTARTPKWCGCQNTYPYPCKRRIDPGDKYVRSVMFPGHDAGPGRYERGARPQVMPICVNCASGYVGIDRLVREVVA
jgi:hypothetical protein